MQNISNQQLMNLLVNPQVKLIDVQTQQDFQIAHLSGSINIPLEVFSHRISQMIKDKNTPIIVYCQKGVRSMVAADILMQKGYRQVYNLKEGFE